MNKRGEVVKLGSLFDKYKNNLKAPQKTVLEAFVEVVGDVISIKIKSSDCAYNVSTRTLVFKGSSLIKQEIKMHQDEILMHLKGRLGEKSCPYIII